MATILFFSIVISVFLFDVFLISSSANARYTNNRLHSSRTAISPKERATRRLVRSLDLSPQEDINSSEIDAPRLNEKKFKFPFLPTSDPSVEDLGSYAGYYQLPNPVGARMFYFFFESRNRNDEDPVVIWLSGGPGISCSIDLFYANGPFHITEDSSLTWNDHGWDKTSNIIYVDQPIGTGLSYINDDSDIRHDLTSVIDDLYNFLKEFFIKHPQFTHKNFFITGRAYAGHYAPALASRILEENEKANAIPIKLKGFAIGNGHINPHIQYPTIPEFALKHNVITELNYSNIEDSMRRCRAYTRNCVKGIKEACSVAFDYCFEMIKRTREYAGDTNFFDIRKQRVNGVNYDYSKMERFFDIPSVKIALNVPQDKTFVPASKTVFDAYSKKDYMRKFDVEISALLEKGIKVLIYAGDQDLLYNWDGKSHGSIYKT
ncbi:serine carboxypeptidase-like 48 [Tripterygium wilfordii]|uniref:serine carboxypeptidase-like 48 n=1 Tax=Tripterygium wilfordii TaxID=458696 RepID=UPI0018F82413|nr:serine carboxypeptidase-like 48 [Tripterygium wilfordii]